MFHAVDSCRACGVQPPESLHNPPMSSFFKTAPQGYLAAPYSSSWSLKDGSTKHSELAVFKSHWPTFSTMFTVWLLASRSITQVVVVQLLLAGGMGFSKFMLHEDLMLSSRRLD